MPDKKILVVDDEKDLCFLMKGILEDTGQYLVFTAYDGLSAVETCLREKPQLIFLDFAMPGMSGDDVVHSLKEDQDTEHIPVVLMSGLKDIIRFEHNNKWQWLSQRPSIQQLTDKISGKKQWDRLTQDVIQKTGITAYLPKPFSKVTLLEVAAALLS